MCNKSAFNVSHNDKINKINNTNKSTNNVKYNYRTRTL